MDQTRAEFWGAQFEDVMTEIAREALICNVRLQDPGVIEAVLHDDEASCGSTNPLAFRKMRELLMMVFVMRDKAVDTLGAHETMELVAQIREQLKGRFGAG